MSDFFEGFLDFWDWFFSTFIKGAQDFLFSNSMSDTLNKLVENINNFLSKIGIADFAGLIIPQVHFNNLTAFVAMSIFIGIGIGLFLLLKKIIFNWA